MMMSISRLMVYHMCHVNMCNTCYSSCHILRQQHYTIANCIQYYAILWRKIYWNEILISCDNQMRLIQTNKLYYINGLAQDCSNYIAVSQFLKLQIADCDLFSKTGPSVWRPRNRTKMWCLEKFRFNSIAYGSTWTVRSGISAKWRSGQWDESMEYYEYFELQLNK